MAVFRAIADGRPGALRARPVRRLPRHRRGRARLDHRDVRCATAGDRQLALVGRAVLHPHRQAAPATQTELRLVFKHPPRLGFAHRRRPQAGAEPAGGQARPDHRRPARWSRPTAPTAGAGADRAGHGVRRRGRRGADALRGAAARRAGRRQHALHAPGRRRGDVADHAAAARRAAAGRTPTPRAPGARRRRTSWSPGTAAGTGRGCVA